MITFEIGITKVIIEKTADAFKIVLKRHGAKIAEGQATTLANASNWAHVQARATK